MEHSLSSTSAQKASPNSLLGLISPLAEADGVLLFDEIQSIPIESTNYNLISSSENVLNRTIDLTNDMINEETQTNDSFHDDIANNDDNDLPFASVISNSSAVKLNDYIQKEKEALNKAHKIQPSFDKKKLFELSNAMNYLSYCSDNYFPRSVVRKMREQKKIEQANLSKDS